MSLTYDQHKAAIDAAYPTPPIDWARQDDHVTFALHEVAVVELVSSMRWTITTWGRTTERAAQRFGRSGTSWHTVRRESTGGVQASWDDAKTAFATYWEDPIVKISGHCWQRRLTARMWLTTPRAMFRWCA